MVKIKKIVPQLAKKVRNTFRLSQKSGLPPGTLLHIGKAHDSPVTVTYVKYNQSDFSKINLKTVADIEIGEGKYPVHWINVDGLTEPAVIEDIGKKFGLHHLMLEDIMNTQHIPKVEEFNDYVFFTLKALRLNTDNLELETEQVSFVLGRNYVLSFQEKPENVFGEILFRMSEGKYKSRGADFLVYRLIDVIIDSYYSVLETLEDSIDLSEEEVFESPNPEHLRAIQSMKRVLLTLRKSVYPLREAINKLQKRDSNFISDGTIKYFRDLYDHTVHVVENIENAREINTGLKDIYLSSMSNKMNKIMQVLTIISTIFIPLSFIVGLYGMNFDHMPELHWKYGYQLIWGIIITIVIIQLFIFRKRKWL